MSNPEPRYTARRFDAPPDPLPWGIFDTRTRSFVAFAAYASKTAAEAAAETYNRACPDAATGRAA